MAKLGMVIMTYTLNDELEQIALRAAKSYRDQVDYLIISEDGGKMSKQLMEIADKYLYSTTNQGFTKNVNIGWSESYCEYTAIVNSDTELASGNLRDLCIPGRVTSPVIENQYIEGLAGPFFVVPKEIKEERGMLNEKMKTYWSDTEYYNRVKDIFTRVEAVTIYHDMAKTVTEAGVEGKDTEDKKEYENLSNNTNNI